MGRMTRTYTERETKIWALRGMRGGLIVGLIVGCCGGIGIGFGIMAVFGQ